jgi:hypothetical protein
MPATFLTEEYLYGQSEILIALGSLAIFFIATEIGYRRGRAISDNLGDIAKSQLSTLQAAVIGLLALLLAFSFALAEGRFETRQSLVVEEANAIDTARLRAQLLPEPYADEIGKSLGRYLDDRIAYLAVGFDPVKLSEALTRSQAEQQKLWALAVAVVKTDRQSPIYALFVSSLNEAFDVAAKRDAARQNHVPEIVLYLLCAAGAVAMGLVGLGTGVAGRRHSPLTMSLAIMITLVILVIIDLDRPRRGVITVSQQSLISLRANLN